MPAACAANWARNVACCFLPPGLSAQRTSKFVDGCCSALVPLDDPIATSVDPSRTLAVPGTYSPLYQAFHSARPRRGRTCGQSATLAPCHAPCSTRPVNLFPDNACQIFPSTDVFWGFERLRARPGGLTTSPTLSRIATIGFILRQRYLAGQFLISAPVICLIVLLVTNGRPPLMSTIGLSIPNCAMRSLSTAAADR